MKRKAAASAGDEPASKTAKEDVKADEKATEETEPKVLPKPSTPEELAHWNQMFFDLMVRLQCSIMCLLSQVVVDSFSWSIANHFFVCSAALQNQQWECQRQVNRQEEL